MHSITPLAALLTITLLGTACAADDDDDTLDPTETEATQTDTVQTDTVETDTVQTDTVQTEAVRPVGVDGVDAAPSSDVQAAPSRPRSAPAEIRPGMSWQWQLQGDLDMSVDADVYDIDLFDTSAQTIGALRDDGRIVICYFSTAWEDWRDDATDFPADALGAPLDDWVGERWVDITDSDVRSLLAARLDLAVEKGCDGVEPDNITAYRNDSGFELDAQDQLDFNRYLAAEAHDRRLLIGLKNGLEQIPDLVDHFDFAVNEQCVQYEECDVYAPFVESGKAVFGAEYSDEAVRSPDTVCAVASAAGISTLILPLELDGSFRTPCP